MDSLVDHITEVELLIRGFMEGRSDAIHDDDRIIDRVAEDGQEGSEEECIDLELRKKI